MRLSKKVKELYRYHETTRLLISVQSDQITRLLTRVHYLEESLNYLRCELEEAIDANL
jgi:hypothetical protein